MAETFFWTADEIETARKMWARGESLTRIGICLGKTRNAIGGLMNRRRDIFPMRGPARHSPTRQGAARIAAPVRHRPSPVIVAKKALAVKKQVAGPDLSPVDFQTIPDDVAFSPKNSLFAPRNPVPFLLVRDSQCKWPLWGKDEKPGADSLCCGEPALVGSSWCRHHMARCIQPPKIPGVKEGHQPGASA